MFNGQCATLPSLCETGTMECQLVSSFHSSGTMMPVELQLNFAKPCFVSCKHANGPLSRGAGAQFAYSDIDICEARFPKHNPDASAPGFVLKRNLHNVPTPRSVSC